MIFFSYTAWFYGKQYNYTKRLKQHLKIQNRGDHKKTAQWFLPNPCHLKDLGKLRRGTRKCPAAYDIPTAKLLRYLLLAPTLRLRKRTVDMMCSGEF